MPLSFITTLHGGFGYSTYPPYGLLVLANNLIRIGIECQVVDLDYEVVSDTIQLTSRTHLDRHNITPLQVLPNTDFAKEMGRSGQKNDARDALYFSGYLERRLYNQVATQTMERLKRKLDPRVYWRD